MLTSIFYFIYFFLSCIRTQEAADPRLVFHLTVTLFKHWMQTPSLGQKKKMLRQQMGWQFWLPQRRGKLSNVMLFLIYLIDCCIFLKKESFYSHMPSQSPYKTEEICGCMLVRKHCRSGLIGDERAGLFRLVR